MTDEAVFPDACEFTYEAVRLYSATPADGDRFLNFHKGADEHFVLDIAAVEVARLDNGDVTPERYIYDSRREASNVSHRVYPAKERPGRT